ncbi:DMT family transporter [Bartonella tamiae]|uniref:EamA domain-containing protein n=1 Tax=Bartonella tamiae Th239 TaxID=1094558 RepID=J0ZQU7_9HYPH|nr:DMT family transporter [Bartonella tamiae]EJF91048.1 hypothetical protein ME5_00380 [Bartonella tamiae Th239]EJF93287.1 hypothetical protein MEG_01501 [Bartonella tamiae Th307]
MEQAPPQKHLWFTKQELSLIIITIVWGATFLIIHLAMRHSGPLFFVGLRFVSAGVLCAVLFWRKMKDITRNDIIAGAMIGIAIFLGYSLQTAGLQTITATQSAFITAVYVPMVPLLQWIVFKKSPGLSSWIGAALAFIGLMLISGHGAEGLGLSTGVVLTLLGAVAIAGEILLIGFYAAHVDSRRVTVVQLLCAGLLAFAFMPLNGEGIPEFSWIWLSAGLSLAIASALIQFTMNWAQKSVSPTRATIIYAGEPVWAGVFGRIAGERLPVIALLGALFILIGILVAELQPSKWRRKQSKN